MIHSKGHKSNGLLNTSFIQQKIILYSLNIYYSMEGNKLDLLLFYLCIGLGVWKIGGSQREFSLMAEISVKVQFIFNVKKKSL